MSRRFSTSMVGCLLAALVWHATVWHGTAVAAPAFDSASLIETWLLPRYDALAAATQAQRDAWHAHCAGQDRADTALLKAQFVRAADAWSAVEFVTLGPMGHELRPDRFNFFPDRRNAVARAVAELLEGDPARLQPGQFPRASVAGQGLPALERLLFDGADAPQACALATAIATNLATIAADVRAAWGNRSQGLLAQIVAGQGDPALPGMILTDLAGAYQRVTDSRILPVLGGGPSDARPLLAEGWRSARSGRVVTVMIGSADALLRLVGKQLPTRPQSVVEKAAAAADAAATGFPADLAFAAQTGAGAAKVQAAIKQFKAAQRTVYRPVASYFDISLGFNALDGD